MAELIVKSNGSGRSKAVPRIDLTPMVDLGFLLITFFMMTTTMAKPKAMDVQMPSTEHDSNPPKFYESSAITLMPASHHQIYYYEGIFDPSIPLKKAANIEALRKVITQKKQTLSHRENRAERDIEILIKSHAGASVTDVIALLDEMNISDVKYYAMVNIDADEVALIDKNGRP